MTEKLYKLEKCGMMNADEAGSQRMLSVDTLTIPAIKFKSTTFSAGGAIAELDLVQHKIEPLEPKFAIKGFDVGAFEYLGARGRWSFNGAYRNVYDGGYVNATFLCEGVISEWESDDMQPDDFEGCTHMIKEVISADLIFDGSTVFRFDVRTGEIVSGGQSRTAEINRTLWGA